MRRLDLSSPARRGRSAAHIPAHPHRSMHRCGFYRPALRGRSAAHISIASAARPKGRSMRSRVVGSTPKYLNSCPCLGKKAKCHTRLDGHPDGVCYITSQMGAFHSPSDGGMKRRSLGWRKYGGSPFRHPEWPCKFGWRVSMSPSTTSI